MPNHAALSASMCFSRSVVLRRWPVTTHWPRLRSALSRGFVMERHMPNLTPRWWQAFCDWIVGEN